MKPQGLQIYSYSGPPLSKLHIRFFTYIGRDCKKLSCHIGLFWCRWIVLQILY